MLAACSNLDVAKGASLSFLSGSMDSHQPHSFLLQSRSPSMDECFSAEFSCLDGEKSRDQSVEVETRDRVNVQDSLFVVKTNVDSALAQTTATAAGAASEQVRTLHSHYPKPTASERDVSGNEHSSVAEGRRSEEEERKLVLASVKDVDCQDFPFDEVLSLERTLYREGPTQQVAQQGSSVVSSNTQVTGLAGNETMKSRIPVGGIEIQRQPITMHNSSFATSAQTKTRIRPPMLKCPTWPNEDCLSDGSTGTTTSDANVTSSILKIDSPSFYSTAQIDFSAISHLSEEHDRRMAQERAETPQNQHPFISAVTKEKLSAKAIKSRAQIQRRGSRAMGRTQGVKITSSGISSDFTVSHSKPNGFAGTARRHTVSEVCDVTTDSSNNADGRKSTKAVMSPLEKEFRKRYALASKSGALVSSSFSSLSEDSTSETADSLIASAATTPAERSDTSKKVTMPMEKQPLPPEGFKITRYPIQSKSSSFQQTSPKPEPEMPEQLTEQDESADPQETIKNLRQELEQVRGRLSTAEKQATEWKEIAQQTLRAAQVIKTKMEVEKMRANRAEGKEGKECRPADDVASQLSGVQGLQGHRRWSNEATVTRSDDASRLRFISAESLAPLAPMIRRSSPRGRKRSVNSAYKDVSPVQQKRPRGSTVPVESPVINDKSDKQQNLLAWLSSSEPDVNGISYVSMLESVPATETAVVTRASNNNRNRPMPTPLTSRSLSHDEVRAALRAKVESAKFLSAPAGPQGPRDTQSMCHITVTSVPMTETPKGCSDLPLPAQHTLSTNSDWSTPVSELGDWVNQTVPVQSACSDAETISDLLWSDDEKVDSPLGISHSLSDSELHTTDKRPANSCLPRNDRPCLSKKLSNSESWPNLHDPTLQFLVADEMNKSDQEFLQQLDSIFEL